MNATPRRRNGKIVRERKRHLLQKAILEALESRVLLTTLPTSIHPSTDAAYTLTGNPGAYTLDITAGSWTFDDNVATDGNGTDFQGLTVNVHNTSTVTFNAPETLAVLSVADTSKVALSPGTAGVNGYGNVLDITTASGLSVGTSSTLDMGDNDMVWANAGSAGLGTIATLTGNGYSGGAWTGAGIDSSSAAATYGSSGLRLTLGYALNSTFHTPFTTFDGITTGSNDVLIKYTPYGDLNFDGVVNNSDLLIISRNWLPTHDGLATTWNTGDMDYNGYTNNADLLIVDHDFLGSVIVDPTSSSYNANFVRTLVADGLPITPVEGEALPNVAVAMFTDNLAFEGYTVNASDYVASVEWGNGNFLTAQVQVIGLGQFNIVATIPASIDPNALILAEVNYAPGNADGLTGRPGALSEPIQIKPAVTNLTLTPNANGSIALNWTNNTTAATEIDVYRTTMNLVFPSTPTFVLAGNANQYSDTLVTANTQYYYQISALQPDYGPSNFAGPAGAWTVPAVATQIAAPAISDTGVLLTWQAPAGGSPPSSYLIWQGGAQIGTSIGTAFQVENLTPGTPYTFSIYAVGPSNEISAGLNDSVTTAAATAADAPPPSAPGTPGATTPDAYSVALTWAASSSSAGLAITYEILRNGMVVGSTSAPYFSESDLSPSTAYQYSVIAFDSNDNASAAATASVTTTSADDFAPSPPTNLIVTANNGSLISWSWSPASDDVGVVNYEVNVAEYDSHDEYVGDQSHTGPDLTYTDTAITPGNKYEFSVTAVDAHGNQSTAASISVVAVTAPPIDDTASHQYIPPAWQNYFYNTLTPALRGMKQLVGTPPAAQGWLDDSVDTTIIDGQIHSLYPAIDTNNHTAVYYHDTNQNGQFDPGETAWIGSSYNLNYQTGDTIIAGQPLTGGGFKPLPVGATGVGGLLTAQDPSTMDADHPLDPSKMLLVDPNEIKGVQGQLAYRDIGGVGSWQTGDPIWVDSNNDSKYDAATDRVVYDPHDPNYPDDPTKLVPLTDGEWGKKNGLNFYDFTPNHSGQWDPEATTYVIWIDHSTPPSGYAQTTPLAPAVFQWDFAGMYQALSGVRPLLNGLDSHGEPTYETLGDILSTAYATPTTLAGEISATPDSQGYIDTITGSGTHFTTDIMPGDFLLVDGDWLQVSVTSDTQLSVTDTAGPLAGFSGAAVKVINWTKVPETSEFGTVFHFKRGAPDAGSLVFPDQFQQLEKVLSTLMQPPAAIYDAGLFDDESSGEFISVATKVIDDYDAIFGSASDTLEIPIQSGDMDPGEPFKWAYIADLRDMTDAVGGAVYVRDATDGLNGWKVIGGYDPSQPLYNQTPTMTTYATQWGSDHWTETDDNGRTLGSYSPIDAAYLSQIDGFISQIPTDQLWLAPGSGTAGGGDFTDASYDAQQDVPVSQVYDAPIKPLTDAGFIVTSTGQSLGFGELGGLELDAAGQTPIIPSAFGDNGGYQDTGGFDEADWAGQSESMGLPTNQNPHGGNDLLPNGDGVTNILAGPESAGLDTSAWQWGTVEPLMAITTQQMYDILTSAPFDPPAAGPAMGFLSEPGLERGVTYTTTGTWYDFTAVPGGGLEFEFNVVINPIDLHPTVFGRVAPDDFSYTPGSPPDNSIAPPPDDPLPITSKMEYENVVPDTNIDDIVQVDHDQTTFGLDTGSISFEPQRDMPQVYLPLNTDGLDSSSDGLPVHAYLVQGGFGTSSTDVGDLGTDAWTYADANENGQPYAYSLDTRVDVDFVIDDPANHLKRIEIVRPRGNTVVFNFAWDADKQEFSPIGLPTGMDSSRLYVLRALDPSDDSSLSYEMLFPSGIVQKFGGANGGLLSVSDANSGLSQIINFGPPVENSGDAGLGFNAAVNDNGDPGELSSSRYGMSLGWEDGRIAAVDYTTAGAATIETNLGYASGGNQITSLDKTNGTAASGNAVPIPQFSYSVSSSGGSFAAIFGNGFEIDRAADSDDGLVTITTYITGVSGYSYDSYTINDDGLITGDDHVLVDTSGHVTSAPTSYVYQPRPEPGSADTTMDNRYANGAPMWGKVMSIAYPDNSWEQFDYDYDTGWLANDVTPFKDSAMQSTAFDSADDGGAVSYDYSASDSGNGNIADVTMLVAPPRVTTTMEEGITTGISYADYHNVGGLTVETRQASSNSGSSWSNAKFDTTTTITGYGSYSTKMGAASVAYSSSDLGDSSVVSFGSTTLSNVADVYNGFGGLAAYSSSGLGQTPVATTSTPTADSFGRVTSAAVTGGLTSTAQNYGWFGPASVTGADHVETDYTYTALGQILTATSLGVTTTYGYDAAGNTVSIQNVGAANNNGTGNPSITTNVSYTYDALGRITSSTDENGTKTTYVYDDSAHTVTTTYNAAGGATYPQNEVDSYYLDGALKSISGSATTPSNYDEGVSSNGDTWTASSIDGGTTWSKSFTNMLGENYMQTTPTADPSNPTATSTTLFDGNGRPTQTTDFDGSIVKTNYDPTTGLADRTTQLSNNGPSRVSTDQYFNDDDISGVSYSGEIVTDLSSSGSVGTTYGEANGGLQSIEIDNGLSTTTNTAIGSGAGVATVTATGPDQTQVKDNYSADLLQSAQQLGVGGGVVTSQSFGYDSLGRSTSSVDPVFGTTSLTLRADGSVASETMPGHNAATVTAADPSTDIPTASTRPDGGTQSQDLNLRGQTIDQQGAGLIASVFGYDNATGQLNDLKIYPSGTIGDNTAVEETQWGYDPASGDMTSETIGANTDHPDVINYGYNGVQQKTTTGEGDTTTLGYNSAGEQTGATSNDGTTKVTDTVEAQDDQGNPVVVTGTQTEDSNGQVDSSATNVFTYANGNVTTESQTAGVTVHYDYYGTGESGEGASPGAIKDMELMQGDTVLSTTRYEYDSVSGRLQSIIVNGTWFSVNYLPNSNVIQSIGTSAVGTTWNYNTPTSGGLVGDLGSISTSITGGATDYSAAYTYYADDQAHTATVAQATASGSINYAQTYSYDSQDELTGVAGTGASSSYSYTYDGAGNRTDSTFTSVHGTANSLNEYTGGADTYNARGDETDDGTESFTWNAANQLTFVTAHDDSFRDGFVYDGQGRLIEEDAYLWFANPSGSGPGAWVLNTTRKLVYDGKQLVAELDAGDHLVDSYAWGPNGLMSVTDFAGTNPKVYLAALDANGNVVQLDDAATGAVDASFTYSPFGEELTATGPAASVGDVRSNGGGIYIAGANLVCDGNRFVSTAEGHWLSEDPAGIAGGSNLFVYCGNDPINNVDPTGLSDHGAEVPGFRSVSGVWQEAKDEVLRNYGIPDSTPWNTPVAKVNGAWKIVSNSGTTYGDVVAGIYSKKEDFYTSYPVFVKIVSDEAYAEKLKSRGIASMRASTPEEVIQANIVHWKEEVAAGHANPQYVTVLEITAAHPGNSIGAWVGTIADGGASVAPDIFYGLYSEPSEGGSSSPGEIVRTGEVVRGQETVPLPEIAGSTVYAPPAAVKFVPNPGGRLGDAVTRAKTQEVVNNLLSRGFNEIDYEVQFKADPLGSGKPRYADIVARNPATGEVEIIQIGQTLKSDPRVPVMRERLALDDIIFSPDIQKYPNSIIRFVDKNRPGVIQK